MMSTSGPASLAARIPGWVLAALVLVLVLVPAPALAEIEVTGGTEGGGILRGGTLIPYKDVMTINYNAADTGDRIQDIEFQIPKGGIVNFTVYYGTSSSIQGSLSRIPISGPGGLVWSQWSIGLGSDYKSYGMGDLNLGDMTDHLTYGRNVSADPIETGLYFYDLYSGFNNNNAIFYPVADIEMNTIYKIEATGNQPFTAYVYKGTYAHVSDMAGKSMIDWWKGIVSQLAAYASMIWSVFYMVVYWLDLIFIQNIVITMALYFMGSLAWCANKSKNIFQFYQNFFKLQKAMIEFIINSFNTLLQMVAGLINALKPV